MAGTVSKPGVIIERVNARVGFFDYPCRTASCHAGDMNKRLCLWLALLPNLFLAHAAPGAVTNSPAVDPAKLAAFMAQWKAPPPYEYPAARADWPLLLAALAKDPGGPWASCLDTLAGDARFQIRQVDWAGRKSWAAALLATLQRAEQIRKQLRTAGIGVTNHPTPFVFEQEFYPKTKAFLALEAGQDLAALKATAQRLLASAKDTNDWNYGNIVFEANESLGRIAVKEGNFEEARRCLRAAGQTRGSPSLNSFGPDFVLPHELLAPRRARRPRSGARVPGRYPPPVGRPRQTARGQQPARGRGPSQGAGQVGPGNPRWQNPRRPEMALTPAITCAGE